MNSEYVWVTNFEDQYCAVLMAIRYAIDDANEKIKKLNIENNDLVATGNKLNNFNNGNIDRNIIEIEKNKYLIDKLKNILKKFD